MRKKDGKGRQCCVLWLDVFVRLILGGFRNRVFLRAVREGSRIVVAVSTGF